MRKLLRVRCPKNLAQISSEGHALYAPEDLELVWVTPGNMEVVSSEPLELAKPKPDAERDELAREILLALCQQPSNSLLSRGSAAYHIADGYLKERDRA